MKTFFWTLVLLATAATTLRAEQYPKATGYVNDFANLLSHEQEVALNDELAAFEKKTTIEIAVVTVSGLNNQSIEKYAQGLASEWGVGKRGQNNGIVLLIAPKERKVRIETASGIREILTDSRANRIRDDVILPRFKAGNMAQGIIDGTQSIMRTVDSAPVPAQKAEAEEAEVQPVKRNESEDLTILGYILGGVIGVTVLLFIAVPFVRRSNARKYVFENQGRVIDRFAEVVMMAKNAGIQPETRKKFEELAYGLASINQMTLTSERVDWFQAQEKLDYLNDALPIIISRMRSDIAIAERAKTEGPELLKRLPDMIEAAEKKLAKGKQSPKALAHLERAKEQYAQSQSQSGMSTTDWVVLYLLLSDAQSNAQSAESAHQWANTEHTPRHSSNQASSGHSTSRENDRHVSPQPSSDDSSSSSFGFGGGGGFGDGGGGSTGSW